MGFEVLGARKAPQLPSERRSPRISNNASSGRSSSDRSSSDRSSNSRSSGSVTSRSTASSASAGGRSPRHALSPIQIDSTISAVQLRAVDEALEADLTGQVTRHTKSKGTARASVRALGAERVRPSTRRQVAAVLNESQSAQDSENETPRGSTTTHYLKKAPERVSSKDKLGAAAGGATGRYLLRPKSARSSAAATDASEKRPATASATTTRWR